MDIPGPRKVKLPKADVNSILQRKSFTALDQALPQELFVVREEPQPDAGIDRVLEVLNTGQYTGMRSHVQVKACTSATPNADGSISFSAEVSNLEYLRHASSPLYVLYIDQTKELRYAWVHDEIRRIAASNPNWGEQETVTIRFVTILNEKGVADIHERIRRDANIYRQFHEILGRSGFHEQARFMST